MPVIVEKVVIAFLVAGAVAIAFVNPFQLDLSWRAGLTIAMLLLAVLLGLQLYRINQTENRRTYATLTPERVNEIFGTNTEIQARKVCADYVGQRLRISGVVSNVYSGGFIKWGSPMVVVKPMVGDGKHLTYPDYFMRFRRDQIPRAKTLRRTEKVSATGRNH